MIKNGKMVVGTPPDGGYGWVIVLSSALSSSIIVPLSEICGFLFNAIFMKLQLSATEIAIILNLNNAFGMIMGPFNAILIKLLNYRTVALISSCLVTIGVTLSAFSTTFSLFILTYGLITSLGMGMNMSAFVVALNTFFKERRSQAQAIAVTIPGFGSIIIPQIINLLSQYYPVEGMILICGAICSHLFIAAMLLQPVELHMKFEKFTLFKYDHIPAIEMKASIDDQQNIEIVEDDDPQPKLKIFDLDLFKDPIFINIMFGMAIEFYADINFTLLIPFILSDIGFTTNQIANFLTTVGIIDLISRLFAPMIGEYCKQPPRFLYVCNIILLVIVRFCLLLSKQFNTLMIVAIPLGMMKGIRKVYQGLLIPQYVCLEKLPSAIGMVMMIEGVIILIGGILIGFIRDTTGDYTISIIILNCITMTTAVMWLLEGFISKYLKFV